MALDASTQDNLARLTTSLKERAGVGDGVSSMYVMWGFFTVASIVTAIAVCFTPQADRRFSEALRAPPPAMELAPAPMIARAEPPPIARPEPDPEPEPDAELMARLKLLEEQLETITGSIAAAPPPPPPPPTGVTPTSADPPKVVRTAPVAPVAPPAPLAAAEPAPAAAAEPAPAAPPPVAVAAAPPPAAAPAVPPAEKPRSPTATTFGLDLGSEASFGALRARWDGLRRLHPELARLTPRIAVRDNRGKVELRLIAGPFENASDAAKACAGLFAKGVSCDGGLFDGQRLPAS